MAQSVQVRKQLCLTPTELDVLCHVKSAYWDRRFVPDVFYRFYHRSEKNACPDLNGLCPRPSICCGLEWRCAMRWRHLLDFACFVVVHSSGEFSVNQWQNKLWKLTCVWCPCVQDSICKIQVQLFLQYQVQFHNWTRLFCFRMESRCHPFWRRRYWSLPWDSEKLLAPSQLTPCCRW